MSLISKTLSGLYNGVSQQAPALRMDSQGEKQINVDSSLIYGITKRPNTEYIDTLNFSGNTNDNVFIHPIDRDENEQYLMVFTNNNIEPLEIFTLDGTKCSISYGADGAGLKNYLTRDDLVNPINPKKHIKTTTVGDYTIVVNKTRRAEMNTGSTTPNTLENGMDISRTGLVYVKTGYPETNYTIKVKEAGTTYEATYTSGTPTSSGVSYIKTDDIAEALITELNTLTPPDYTISREGSVITVSLDDANSNFTIQTSDSYGDQSLLVAKGVVQNMSDLPPVAPVGYIMKIEGNAESAFDNFYVKYVQDTSSGTGIWEETTAIADRNGYALVNSFNVATLPKRIIRTAPNTFEVKNIEWKDRIVGDDVSSPYPSFVDKPINNVFFSKNRLGFLAGESFILSRSGDYFNFWSNTATDVLDTDPIDAAVSTNQVSQLENAIPFGGSLLAFSKKVQFMIHGGASPLTPKTAVADPTTHFDNNIDVEPVGAGANIYFVVPNGQYSSIREYFIEEDAKRNDAINITSHVPKYISGNVDSLISSTAESILMALDSTSNEMFIYRYFWNGEERLQNSWFKWKFPEVDELIDGTIINSELYLIVRRGTEFELLKLSLEEKDTNADIGFRVHLDRLTEIQGTYDDATNKTRFTLPFDLVSDDWIMVNSNTGYSISSTYMQPSPNIIEVTGDFSDVPYFVGLKYLSLYEFSKFYAKDDEGNPVIQGRLQVRNLSLTYTDTGYFTVRTKIQHRDSSWVDTGEFNVRLTEGTDIEGSENINNALIGVSEFGTNGLVSGEKKFSILSRNSSVAITIESESFLPFNIQTASYEAIFTSKSNF